MIRRRIPLRDSDTFGSRVQLFKRGRSLLSFFACPLVNSVVNPVKGLTNRFTRGLHAEPDNGARPPKPQSRNREQKESEVFEMVKFRVLKRYPDGKYLLERNVNGIRREIVVSDFDGIMFHVNFMKHANPTVEWVGEERKRG